MSLNQNKNNWIYLFVLMGVTIKFWVLQQNVDDCFSLQVRCVYPLLWKLKVEIYKSCFILESSSGEEIILDMGLKNGEISVVNLAQPLNV